jgi:hypothetical protein
MRRLLTGHASFFNKRRRRNGLLFQKGYNLKMIAERVCSVMNLEPSEIWKVGKLRKRVAARSLLCLWAFRELGINMTELSR